MALERTRLRLDDVARRVEALEQGTAAATEGAAPGPSVNFLDGLTAAEERLEALERAPTGSPDLLERVKALEQLLRVLEHDYGERLETLEDVFLTADDPTPEQTAPSPPMTDETLRRAEAAREALLQETPTEPTPVAVVAPEPPADF